MTNKSKMTNKIKIITPTFHRLHSDPSPSSPPTDWEDLRQMDAITLREIGLRPWGREEDEKGNEVPESKLLWLFPGEWYYAVPNGFKIVDIFFKEDTFMLGITDDDIRFGCLSFGIMGPE